MTLRAEMTIVYVEKKSDSFEPRVGHADITFETRNKFYW